MSPFNFAHLLINMRYDGIRFMIRQLLVQVRGVYFSLYAF